MTSEELIGKQQLEIEKYKKAFEENRELIKDITCKFVCIGQPLNDNLLQFNKEQIKWCFEVLSLVEQLNENI